MSIDTPNLAVFVDYDNVAIGARDARYGNFDVHLVLERLLEKGNVIVKKAYANWAAYESAKRPMHEAAFELIEIPKTSYSGKNSADIRLVVDALDLCYAKPHLNVVAIISGDSDFSPLVSKLRENGKTVIGVGVKSSTSNLLVENCDEFIYYDDLVRESRRSGSSRRKPRGKPPAKAAKSAKGARGPKSAAVAVAAVAAAGGERGEKMDPGDRAEKRQEVLDLVLDTVEALFRDRDDNVWGSHVKQLIKRKQPHFSETYYGYRSFSDLLEDARAKGLLEIEKDSRGGGYRILEFGPNAEV